MQGFQLAFMTEQGRRIEGKPAVEWLLNAAKDVGCSGATTFAGMESYGAGGHHSAHFIELADQPVQVIIAVTDDQATALLTKVGATKTHLFYTKTAVEYGTLGTEA
jgi:PII-like signaling protein